MRLHTLPTYVQHYLCLYIYSTIKQHTSYLSGPVCTHLLYFLFIVTTINVTYFSASSITFFLYFLKTDNVSGYIITPIITDESYDNNLSACPPTTFLRHTLQHIFRFTQPSPTYAQTYFRNSLTQNYIPPSVQSKRKSYV